MTWMSSTVNVEGSTGRSNVTMNADASGEPSAARWPFSVSPGWPTGPIVLLMIRGPAAVTAGLM